MNATEHPIDREEVMAYLDGELPRARAALVLGHLEQCAECRGLAADLREVSRQMAAWQVEPAPAASAPFDVSAPPASWQPAPRWRVPRWALASGGVAAVLVLGLVTQTMRRSPSNEALVVLSAPAPVTAAQEQPVHSPARFDTPAEVGNLARQRDAKQLADSAARAPAAMMARTATVNVLVDDVDAARARIESLLRERQGYVSELTVAGDASSGRTLTTTVRVPTPQLDSALAAIRVLGRVIGESQTGEDVLEQSLDLQARLTNARVTEERLNRLLRERTGRITDVLEVEREVTRVRGEIERLDAQRKNLETRVAFAIVQLTVSDAPKASLELGTLPTSTRLRNALVDGSRQALDSALEATAIALRVGPVLLLWLIILAWPARILWRRFAATRT